jgi:hypothetical protein
MSVARRRQLLDWGPVPHFCPEELQPVWLTPEVGDSLLHVAACYKSLAVGLNGSKEMKITGHEIGNMEGVQ